MSGSLKGRVALVTGSTGEGMGRSIALTLARDGADVVLNHGTNRRTSATNNRRLVKAIEGLGTRAIVVRADTAKGDEVRKMFTRAEQELGPVDRSEEHTSELQSRLHLVCRLLLEKK